MEEISRTKINQERRSTLEYITEKSTRRIDQRLAQAGAGTTRRYRGNLQQTGMRKNNIMQMSRIQFGLQQMILQET